VVKHYILNIPDAQSSIGLLDRLLALHYTKYRHSRVGMLGVPSGYNVTWSDFT